MCPDCQQPLVAFELEGIEIDRCVDCGGVWLDAGELELIADRAGTKPGELTQALHEAKGKRNGKRRCPRCRRKLRVIHVGSDPGVELDRCPWGDGLWLDQGEMQELISAFHEGEEGAVADFFADFFGRE